MLHSSVATTALATLRARYPRPAESSGDGDQNSQVAAQQQPR
jgi:hypothetical protein